MAVSKKSASLMAAAAAVVSASVLELPVHIQNTYASVQFQIGTPPKPYRLMFDTGSSSAWMVSSECTATSCPNLSGYDRIGYNASASSSSADLGSWATIPYIAGDGVTGAATRDVFADESASLTWNQTFLAANASSWRFITTDGFLGLGFSSIAENGTASLAETLLWAGQLDAPRFGLYYGANMANEGPQNGVLTVGGSREADFVDGDGVVYAPLRKEDPYQLWRAPLRSVNVVATGSANTSIVVRNDGRLPTTSTGRPLVNANGAAVFDTGAGRVSVPSNVVDAVYYNLGWNHSKLLSGAERFECRHLNASWALAFTLGESADGADAVTFSIRGDEFVRPGDQCMPPVDDSDGAGFALIGAAFLRRHYSVFDFGADTVDAYQPRIGFGRLKKGYDYLYQ